ncbi:hypothetical protein [Streptomyces phaeofaciens]|uniref:hypothetical protein n=1 Tax=Streptomyces phaeofaciens TaxID=68254 RepID=UPI0036987361
MTRYGYFLASEEFTPGELLEQARAAERAGFEALAISDAVTAANWHRPQTPK